MRQTEIQRNLDTYCTSECTDKQKMWKFLSVQKSLLGFYREGIRAYLWSTNKIVDSVVS